MRKYLLCIFLCFSTLYSFAQQPVINISSVVSGPVYTNDKIPLSVTSDQDLIGLDISDFTLRGGFLSDFNQRNYEAFRETFGSIGNGVGQISKPTAIAHYNGKIYITDLNNYNVQIYDKAGTYQSSFGSFGNAQGQFENPNAITIQQNTGRVFVADITVGNVQVFDSSGIFIFSFGAPVGRLYPNHLAVDDDNIYVTDAAHRKCFVYDLSGNYLYSISSEGAGPGEMYNIVSLVILNGKVYMGDQDGTVSVFTKTGTYIGDLVSYGPDDGQFYRPSAMTTDTKGNLYIYDFHKFEVQMIDTAGNYIRKFGSRGSANYQFEGIKGICISGNDIYLTDDYYQRISKWSIIQDYTLNLTPEESGFVEVSIDENKVFNVNGNGNIATDTFRIYYQMPFQININSTETGISFLNSIPVTISLSHEQTDFDQNDLLVTNGSIADFNGSGKNFSLNLIPARDGHVILRIPAGVVSTNTSLTNPPTSFNIYVDFEHPVIHITSPGNGITNKDTVDVIFTPSESIVGFDISDIIVENDTITELEEVTLFSNLYRKGQHGSGESEFNYPIDINFASGRVYVADFNNNRVQIFDEAGNFMSAFGSEGTDPGQFQRPYGIAVDSTGNVYVSDFYNARIQVFNKDGVFLRTFGYFGYHPGGFFDPGKLVIKGEYLYILQMFHDVVQKFHIDGTYISQAGGQGEDPGQFGDVMDIEYADNKIYIADANSRIHIFDADLNFIEAIEINQNVSDFQSFALDQNGKIYISDSYTGVHVFDASGNYESKLPLSSFQYMTSVFTEGNNIYFTDGGSSISRYQYLTTYKAILTPQPDDSIGIHIPENVFSDIYGKGNIASDFSIQYSKPLRVTLNTMASGLVNQSFNVQVEFNSDVSDFEMEDVTVLNGVIINFSGSDKNYSFDVLPDSNGIVVIQILSGVVHTDKGVPNDLSSQIQVFYDDIKPLISINSEATSDNTILKFNMSEPVTGFDLNDIEIEGATLSNLREKKKEKFVNKMGINYDPGQPYFFYKITTYHNNIYILDAVLSKVLIYDKQGNFQSEFGNYGSEPCEFIFPTALAFDNKGYLYIADCYNSRVQIFNSNGDYIKSIGTPGTDYFLGQLNQPVGIAINNDRVYIADGGIISIFDTSGVFIKIFSEFGYGNGQLNNFQSLVIANQKIYAAGGDGRVQSFNLNGDFLSLIAGSGYSDDQFLSCNDIAVNTQGSIYVSDYYLNTVKVFDSAGNYLRNLGRPGFDDGEFNIPSGIATDQKYIYVTDDNVQRVQVFDVDQSFTAVISADSIQDISVRVLQGTVTDLAGNTNDASEVYDFTYSPPLTVSIKSETKYFSSSIPVSIHFSQAVADFDVSDIKIKNASITNFTGNGKDYSATISFQNIGAVAVGIDDGVAHDNLGNANLKARTLYLQSDTLKPAVNISGVILTRQATANLSFNLNEAAATLSTSLFSVNNGGSLTGNTLSRTSPYLSQFGSEGNGNGQFSGADKLAVYNGKIYVVDYGNDRIQIFNESGVYISQFGYTGSNDGELIQPEDIAVDSSGNIYVLDSYNTRIQVFDEEGNYIRQFGFSESGNRMLQYPSGISVADEKVFVVDDVNMIYVFNMEGRLIRKFDAPQSNPYSEAESVYFIDGKLYITDSYGSVHVTDESGNYLYLLGEYGNSNGQFNFAGSIAADHFGNIYVTDLFRNNVQVFSPEGNYIRRIGEEGSSNGRFSGVSGIAVYNGKVFLADPGNRRVQILRNAYTLSATINLPNEGITEISLTENTYSNIFGNGNKAIRYNVRRDNTRPKPVITSVRTSPTSANPIAIKIDFLEEVTDFVNADVTVNNGTKSGFSGSGRNYTLNITPSGNKVTIRVNIAAGRASDLAGNQNIAADEFSIYYDQDAPLPVEVLSFEASAENTKAKLEWSTASEFMHDYFEIERSIDGKKFEPVAIVKNDGTSTSIKKYVVYDNNPHTGINYYRLMQYDINSISTDCGVRFVKFNSSMIKDFQMSLYPNPASSMFNIVSTISSQTKVRVRITDVSGRIIKELILDGASNIEVNTTDLNAGIYFVNLDSNGVSQTEKIVIVK